ncbi:MAG: hypothetical protein D6767_00380, partial [Candidatus Hydrogenedentota bacterium]
MFMPARKAPFQQVLCYHLSSEGLREIERVRPYFARDVAWHYANRISEIANRIFTDTLVIAEDKNHKTLQDNLFQIGVAKLLSLNEFLESPSLLARSGRSIYLSTAGLAFLPSYLEKLVGSLLESNGIRTILLKSLSEVQKFFKSGQGYLVLDNDFAGLSARGSKRDKTKSEVHQYLKWIKNQFAKVSITVIKDFEKGSLFDDISSPVKEYCNVILSPAEYILFLQNYLYEVQAEKIEMDYLHYFKKEWNSSQKQASMFTEPKVFMRNMKQAYKRVTESNFSKHRQAYEQYVRELEYLQWRMKITEWLEDYLSSSEQAERSSFEFYETEQNQSELISKELKIPVK